MSNSRTWIVYLAVASAGLGCAAPQHPAVALNAAPPGACEESKDRAAIAAMAGSYHVSFDFEETEIATPGYERHKPLHTGGTELVIAIQNEPGRVSLQHILVIGSGPNPDLVKHWRQDWAFQDTELLEFAGHNTFNRRTVSAEAARCTWTQAVFEVDDTPRYEGIGHWQHDAQGSVWQSNQTWRPLPRRDYTKRSDYDVLLGVNRHRITAQGWQHEQDNAKLVLEPRHELVHERGINHYAKVDPSTTTAASEYWAATSAFWGLVRAEWARRVAGQSHLELVTLVDGKRLYDLLFERIDARADPAGDAAFIHDAIGRYVVHATP
ncbi:MAG: DUF6607 family protein [Polyangiaceae bacterium]